MTGTRRAREGWARTGTKGKLGAVYTHVASGWVIKHCGHPTANWPYYGLPPGVTRADGNESMLTSGGMGLGYAFRLVEDAQAAVEEIVRTGHVHDRRCVREDQFRCGFTSYLELSRACGARRAT